MKSFFTKKLPAILLALTLVGGMMPAALAVSCSHNDWGAWVSLDDTYHQRKCTVNGCTGTEEAKHTFASAYKYNTTEHWKECSVCGAQQVRVTHTFSGWKSSASSHWKECTTCGYKINEGGHIDRNRDNKCDTCGRSVSTTSSSSSSSADITYKVDAGETVTFVRGDFKDLYEDVCGGSFDYVVFKPDSSYKSACGSFYFDYDGKEEEKITKSDMEDYEFEYSKNSDYPINSLSFVAAKDASSHTITLDCVLYGDDDDVKATVAVKIGKGSSSSSGKADLVMEVEPDDEILFDRAAFKELFEDEYDDDTFRSVVFTDSDNLSSSTGLLYFDYDGKDEEKITKSTLDDYEFEYSKSGDYPLNKLSFLADEDADGEVVTLEFTLQGDDETLDGVLEIRIGDVEDDEEDGDISYTVAPGDEVAFDRADFNKFFKEEYSKTVR